MPQKLERNDWAPRVKQSVHDFVSLYGAKGGYAVFDFDNTTAVFDVEHQLVTYQCENMLFAASPAQLEAAFRACLGTNDPDMDTDLNDPVFGHGSYNDWIGDVIAAYARLWAAYGPFTGEALSASALRVLRADPWWLEFAAKARALFTLSNNREDGEHASLFPLYFFTGMTRDQIYRAAYASHVYNGALETAMSVWESPNTIPSRLGVIVSSRVNGVSVTENIRELWRTLSGNGIDVYVCSASGTPQVQAAIDAFGLHGLCRGMTGLNVALDENGRQIPAYEWGGSWYDSLPDGTWRADSVPLSAIPRGKGKTQVITEGLYPRYHAGPLAGFMDSTGDFDFCTAFDSLKLVICFNRASLKPTDGGALVAAAAVYQQDILRQDLQAANENGDTLYVLQGRDENGPRTLRPDRTTVVLGAKEERLFRDENVWKLLWEFTQRRLSLREILNTYSRKTASSELGFSYGFLPEGGRYHTLR